MLRFLVILFVLVATSATAAERITSFDVYIEVQRDGDIEVTETIAVIAEGRQIRRGIFRDLPRYYTKESKKLPYRYDVISVTRAGVKEPYAIEQQGNAYRIRIGDADIFLPQGPQTYEIKYEVKNQVRYYGGYDEIYWNVTGNYWAFPIAKASARIVLPGGAAAIQSAAYTGRQGGNARDYLYQYDSDAHIFETTQALDMREGMTISVGFEKGVVDPPSSADARAEWWALNASRAVLAAAFLVVGLFYVVTWRRIGRDPVKGPVFARYEPPEGYSPAAAHHIYHRGLKGHDALVSSLMDLATKGRINIDVNEKKETKITHLIDGTTIPAGKIEDDLLESLCSAGESFQFGDKYNATFTGVYGRFKKSITAAYGEPYFRWNRGFLIAAAIVSALAVLLAANVSIEWTSFHTGAVAALLAMAGAASYFLPAPTAKGQDIRTRIEGFRLYLKTAEELQLNAVDVGGGAPPPMTVERYERFLPYAVALGVEKPWTQHFEKLMPREAAEYRPHWGHSGSGGGRSLGAFNKALVVGISSGVSSSLPQSSSSSGSGGGGFSGGGGGGGGGGGW